MKPESDTSEESSNEEDYMIDQKDFKTASGFDPDSMEITITQEANCMHELILPKGFK